MKQSLILTFMLLPFALWAQGSMLSEIQSKQRIEKLAKLVQQYDTRYDYFNFVADCNIAIFTNDKDNRQGIVDLDGKVLLPCEYHIYRQHGTSLFLVVGDTLMGLIDKNAHWVLPLQYDYDIDCPECMDMGGYFNNGYACLSKNWNYGVVDTSGKVLVPFKFNDGPFGVDFTNRMLYFFNNEEEFNVMTITDFNGKKLIGPYQWIDRFSEGLAGFQKNDKYGFLNTKGKVVIPARYDFSGWEFKNGLALVTKDEQQMIIDKNGNVKHLFKGDYDVLKPLWGYSAFVVKKYHNIDFSLEGEFGVVDNKGKQLVPVRYSNCCVVNDKYFVMIDENGSCDIFDRKGTLIASFQQIYDILNEQDEVSQYTGSHFVVMKDSLCGIADSNFNIVLPCRYQTLSYIGRGFATVVNPDESVSLIDLTGKTIIEGPYNDIDLVSDQLFKFYTYNPDKYDEMVVGFIDIYGNSTATKSQKAKMQAWFRGN